MGIVFAVSLTVAIAIAAIVSQTYLRSLFRSDFDFLKEDTRKIVAVVRAHHLRQELGIERTRVGDLRIFHRRSRFWFRSSYRCVLSGVSSVRYRPGTTQAYEAASTSSVDGQLVIINTWLAALARELGR